MHAAVDRLEFAPPATPGQVRAFVLAVLAHALLVAALTWGVHWKREAQITSAEAELWAAVPQAAAPRLQEPPPEPAEPRKVTPVTKPAPEPVAEPPKVDIALAQEKQRALKQKQLELEKQREKLKLAKLQQEKLQAEKLKELKADKLKQDLAAKAKQVQDQKMVQAQAKQLEAQRQKNLQRMTGLAGATGGSAATGTALKSAGPSASYAGRINARIKPNIVFTENIQSNPTAEVEVRTAPDGTIVGRKIVKSSGLKSWDDAVLKAIDKTDVLPRDVDGSMPSSLLLVFRPKD